nr:uncharacterized protein CTRU02_01904 [Colletotrichum truncatum]KAF6799033.1 hypothetical protein CTRU02_01904 [Colletotrichum truncatum]
MTGVLLFEAGFCRSCACRERRKLGAGACAVSPEENSCSGSRVQV